MVKVSIIMPVFNGAQYLHEAIDSVLNQTYSNFEFIIVNDGSTDDTAYILEYYKKKDTRIKIITNKWNIGIAKSLNIGINNSLGRYIARIDADDIWKKSKLFKQVEYLENNPHIYLLGTNKILINSKGNIIKNNEYYYFSDKDIRNNILKHNLFCHSSVIFRKSIIQNIGAYNENYINSEDYEYWIRIIANYKCSILPYKLVYYRITPEMISIRKRKEQFIYVIKAKISGLKLFPFKLIYIFFLLKDVFFIIIPNFIIIKKLKNKKH